MTSSTVAASADTLLRQARVSDAMQALSAQVKQHPADPAKRVFLFQLLALMGQWERAENQLKVAGELDARNAMMVSAYQLALRGERERAAVFAGSGNPTLIGEPSEWHAQLLQAFRWLREGHIAQALELRGQAFEAAETVRGSIDGEPFEWIADADSRFGPCLEMIVNGAYAWVPFSRFSALRFDAPTDLRDTIWAPAQITWRNGGETVGFVPCRYYGSEQSDDAQLMLARRTDWTDCRAANASGSSPQNGTGSGDDCFIGSGQRMLATDAGEYPLLDVRTLTFDVL
ncbi:type VI secretion system accessory protein TagJ [Paraburkholderia rhizosphaerae]|uniref:type VI secretion system accessory protein TagJ n=1 Tax=Paraburkholderia rhizosphaerae TaxID=480658 RepID=UPI001FB99FB2|nr:type VI secretion system accessory protein TagJ [Paraburkholderia rhizosphaerae]